MKLTAEEIEASLAEMREKLERGMREYEIPQHMHDGILDYAINGIEPGSFLFAVFCDRLCSSFAAADHINFHAMKNYAGFMYNAIPEGLRGSEEQVRKWMSIGGYRGLLAKHE